MSYHLYLLSDATGETVEHVVRAALSQFKGLAVRLHKFGNLRTHSDVLQAIEKVVGQPGLIIYTLVNAELTELLRNEVANRGLEAVDLINPLIYKMSNLFEVSPQEEPGLLYQVNADYYKRMEAVNYTVKQDDGQELRNLCKADLVLVGVSRTSKTPLSMYLAHKGYKVANVPLVKGIAPPQELNQLDEKKVVGLIISVDRLVELRSARLRTLRQNPRGSYADYLEVEEELDSCRRLYRRHPGWQVVDVTNKSVEESASEILRKLDNGGAP
jgi:[pyruvate, water dikinase]-phosphate phosphotransferase / [pyruvate, water dikinase] kinase